MTRAMLLCAGYGTRLGELSSDMPKPMLPVCDSAIVRYGVALLVGHGVTDIVINLHHRGDTIERNLGDGSTLGAAIRYSHEPELLGTGGGLRNALDLLDPDGTDEPFISMNGKLIFDLDITALLAAHRDDPDVLGTLVVRKVPDALEWGPIDAETLDNGRLRVRHILADRGDYMFCGVHVTRPSVVRKLPEGESCSIRQGYIPGIAKGAQVGAFECGDVYFAEHSTPERYLDSNLALLSGATLRFPPAPQRGVSATAHIPPTAVIRHPVKIGDSAHIGEHAVIGPEVVIGAHAVVEPKTIIAHSVVWPRARVSGMVANTIVAGHATIALHR